MCPAHVNLPGTGTVRWRYMRKRVQSMKKRLDNSITFVVIYERGVGEPAKAEHS